MPKKCVVCGKIISEKELEIAVPYKNRMAHKSCFDNAIKMIRQDKIEQLEEKKKKQKETTKEKRKVSAKPKAELKDGLSDEEYLEKRGYYDYLKQALNTDKLSAKIYTLSGKYLDQFDSWSWRGMKDALVYLNEIKGKEITEDIVGYLPYIYEEAVRFFDDVRRVEESNKEASLSDMYKTKRMVYHKKPQKIIEDLVIESIDKSKQQ